MNFNIQPIIETEKAILYPLQEDDFENLFEVASDPKIWEQHPNKDRWKKEVFQVFFNGAIQSKGAFKIIEKTTEKVIGSTRYYGYNGQDKSIFIGYTFYAKKYWGQGINPAIKTAMLDYIFQFVSSVYFQIGACNIRSQIAISRVGAEKVSEENVAYFGEEPKLNFIYKINQQDWRNRSKY